MSKITLKGKAAKFLLNVLKESAKKDTKVKDALGDWLTDNADAKEVSYPDFFQDYPVGLDSKCTCRDCCKLHR